MLIDMSPAELKEYKGISPKPTDFDEYWERALAEMKSVDPQVEITPAKFQGKNSACYDMYFTGVKGARVYCKYALPRNYDGKLPAVLYFHGYSGHSPFFPDLFKWASEGYAVFALDVRGQGGKSEDVGGVKGNTLNGHIIRGLDDKTGESLLFRHIFLDTAELAEIVSGMDNIDATRIYAMGGSQGGGLTLACASLSPHIKKAAPTYPFLSDYKRVWEMDRAECAYAELKDYFRRFDPRHEHENEIFNTLGYIDVHNLAPRITAKLQMQTALMDTVCPPSTQFAAYNNMTCEKNVIIYPDFGHEGLPNCEEIVLDFFAE